MLHSILNTIQPNDPRIQSLKFVALGGAKTPRSLIQKAKDFGLPIYEGYGLSECSSVVSLNLPHAYKTGSVGKPLSNRKIRIAEDHEIEIFMEDGVHYLGGASTSYTWFKTGDIGHLDEDGFLFIDGRKKQRISSGKIKGSTGGPRRIKLKGEMICKQAEGLERWVDGKNCKWVSKTYDMSKFHQNKFILIYGKQEDAEKMDKWFKPTRNLNVELALLSERELKLVEKVELHNLIPFSKFMEGKNKPFQRIATACLIDKLSDEQRYVFRNSECLKPISTDLYNKVTSLRQYRDKNFKDINDEYRNIIIEHAKEVGGFDMSIYSTVVEIENICKKLPFLDSMMSNMRYYGDVVDNDKPLLAALKDLFKYHKHRIDWKNYRIRFNEDLPLEETLTTETVEELINQD